MFVCCYFVLSEVCCESRKTQKINLKMRRVTDGCLYSSAHVGLTVYSFSVDVFQLYSVQKYFAIKQNCFYKDVRAIQPPSKRGTTLHEEKDRIYDMFYRLKQKILIVDFMGQSSPLSAV